MVEHKQGDGKGETLDVANSNKNKQYVDCYPEYAGITLDPWQNDELPSATLRFPLANIVYAKSGSYAGPIKSK